MNNEKTLHNYVYRMMISDIYNGKFSYREQLPSLLELTARFSIGRNTMRSVILELQENGYIKAEKGKKPTVIFDIHKIDANTHYRQTLVDCQVMSKNIFETLEYILPELSVVCLKSASKEQMDTLIEMTNNISFDNLKRERDVIDNLVKIYMYGFSLMNNPIFTDLILTLLRSVNLPISKTNVDSNLHKNIKYIKSVLHMLFPFALKRNSVMIKKMIQGLCHLYGNMTNAFIERNTDGFTKQKEIEFVWIWNHEHDYLYDRVMLRLMWDINNGVFSNNALPSYERLSKRYDISIRTLRRVVAMLKEYHIVKTINGVGSYIIIDKAHAQALVRTHPDVLHNIQEYYYSLQLLTLIVRAILPKVVKKMNAQQLIELADELELKESFTLEPVYKYVFGECNQCLQSIHQELRKLTGWSVIVNHVVDFNQIPYDFDTMDQQLVTALRKQKIPKVIDIVNLFGDGACCVTQQVLDIYM